MTVSTTDSKVVYTADGAETVYAYTYRMDYDDDMEVYLNRVLTPSGYTVAREPDNIGGTVTFNTAPPTDDTITLLRVIDLTQETDYVAGDPFPAEAHEDALDKLTMEVQQVQEQVDRNTQAIGGEEWVDTAAPPFVANKGWKWSDGTDKKLINTEFDPDEQVTLAANSAAEAQNSASSAAASSNTSAGYASDASDSADDAQLRVWEAEAEALTSDSYATQAHNVPVDIFTSNGDGTFTDTPTDPAEYSSLHWSIEASSVGGVPEAPIDGEPYVRANGGWVEALKDPPLLAQSSMLKGVLSIDNVTVSPTYEAVAYTGNGTSQDIVTGIESRDLNYASGTTYQIGQLAFDRTAFKLWKALSINTGVTPVEGANWTEVDDDVVESHPSSRVWIKRRGVAVANHSVTDTLRGVTNLLLTDLTAAEILGTAHAVSDFIDTGFSITGTGSMSNASGSTYIAWQEAYHKVMITTTNQSKRALVAFDDVSNRSMVLYEGSGTTGHEIPHGLGQVPDAVTVKALEGAVDWEGTYKGNRGYLNLDNAHDLSPLINYNVNILSLDTTSVKCNTTENYIAYCQASSSNQKIGTYSGTGASGNEIYCGFKPAYVMIKRIDVGATDWKIADNLRETTDKFDGLLSANDSAIESLGWAPDYITDSSTGFTVGTSNLHTNTLGGEYLFIAYADTNADGGGSEASLPSLTSNLQITDGVIGYSDSFDANGAVNSTETASGTISPTGGWK